MNADDGVSFERTLRLAWTDAHRTHTSPTRWTRCPFCRVALDEMAVEATKRREVAIAQVEEHAAPDVRSLLLKAVRAVAERQPMLTSEDVILAYTGTTPHEPRVLGAVMREAKRQGWIVPTEEWRLSVRPESHRRPQRVWRSLVFGVVA